MLLIAIKMLIGDRAKYIGIVVGLSFAAFIITQQGAIFLGIIDRTFGFITDTSQPNIWVMDPTVLYIDDIKPMKDTELFRVRSVEGVAWAVPLYKGLIEAKMRTGVNQTCILIGIDNATLIGGPPTMSEGELSNLRMPDAIVVSDVGATTKLASPSPGNPKELIPLTLGDVLELNDNRAVVEGLCTVSRTFQSQPVIYTTYGRATTFAPKQRKMLSFILVHSAEGIAPEELAGEITKRTGLAAYTPQELKDLTLKYYMVNTGIFVNFGVAIALGFVIGIAVAGQTFYNFTLDNLRYFGTFKAMGADNKTIAKMILLQALFVSAIGWGIGIGIAALFGFLASGTELSFKMPLALYLASAISILFICLIAACISMRKVLKTDPAIVFRS
jgi:putative ABC transport system permease protein